MDLNELNNLFVGEQFFYYSTPCGVVSHIGYDAKTDQYIVFFYGNLTWRAFPSNYIRYCYTNKLKFIRMCLLGERSIQRLVHFTTVSNLSSILENGILSRYTLNKNNYNYTYSDSIRLDSKLNFISNSITFPNYKMFYSKRKEAQSVKWVVLGIDSEILIDRFDTEFYRMNAASSDLTKCRFNPCSNDALADMFYAEDRDPMLPINYTTNPQAEVMVKDIINSSYIRSVHTCQFDDYVKYLANNSNIDYESNSSLFAPRKDYKRWQHGS